MKHFLKIPVLICLLSQNVWAELEIGQIPKTIELKDGKLNSGDIKKLIQVIREHLDQ